MYQKKVFIRKGVSFVFRSAKRSLYMELAIVENVEAGEGVHTESGSSVPRCESRTRHCGALYAHEEEGRREKQGVEETKRMDARPTDALAGGTTVAMAAKKTNGCFALCNVRSPDDPPRLNLKMFQLLAKRKKMNKQQDTNSNEAQRRPMFAMICVNNVNRSTAAHDHLQAAGLRVCSYGAGRCVSLPGATSTTPRVFEFATPYERMHATLQRENSELFTRNGVLQMLERDIATKPCPERWQSLSNKQLQQIDVVVCLDYRVFLTVLEDLSMRIRLSFKKKRLHVICLDVEDTPDDAVHGGQFALSLCQEIDDAATGKNDTTKSPGDLTEDRVKAIVMDFEKRHHLQMFYLGLRL
ncbi:Rna polymerase ii subunit a cterminal domain phosphatase, partial [Globisporangium splendens]